MVFWGIEENPPKCARVRACVCVHVHACSCRVRACMCVRLSGMDSVNLILISTSRLLQRHNDIINANS